MPSGQPAGRRRYVSGLLPDLDQVAGSRRDCRRRRKLRRTPRVEDRYLVHAGDGAIGSAGFFRQIFATNVFGRVFLQRNGGIAALLRAIVHQAILANVEIARPGAAAPLIGAALRNIVLEAVDPGETALLHRLHLAVDPALLLIQRLQLPRAIVNDADGRAETQAQGTLSDDQRILRVV